MPLWFSWEAKVTAHRAGLDPTVLRFFVVKGCGGLLLGALKAPVMTEQIVNVTSEVQPLGYLRWAQASFSLTNARGHDLAWLGHHC